MKVGYTSIIKDLAAKMQEEHPRWRYGQAIFNAAHQLFPSSANLVRGSSIDCYHNDQNVEAFLLAIDSDLGYRDRHPEREIDPMFIGGREEI